MAEISAQKLPIILGSTAKICKGLFIRAMDLSAYNPDMGRLVVMEAAVAGMRRNITGYPSHLLDSFSIVSHNIAQMKEHKNGNQVLPLYEPQAMQYKAEISEITTERDRLSHAIADLIKEKDELFPVIVRAKGQYRTTTSQIDKDLAQFEKKRRALLDQADALNRNEENLQRKIDQLANTSKSAAEALLGENYRPSAVPPRELR